MPGVLSAKPKPGVQRIVKVAVVGDFSGPPPASGRNELNSLQVEADQVNASGGVLGSRVEVVAADSELNPVKAAALVRQQLADDEVKLLVGPNFTAGYMAVKGDIAQATMPNCVTSVTDDALTGSAFTFRSDAGQRSSVTTLLAYVHRSQPDVKKLGLLDAGDETAQSYDRQLTQQAPRLGLTYLGHASATEADAGPAVQRLVGMGAQAVVLSTEPASAARIALAVQQSGASPRPLLLGFQSLSSYEFPSLAGDAAVNAAFTDTSDAYLTDSPDASWPAGYRTFVHNLTHQYGYATNGVDMNGSPAVADCLLQWSRAATRAGSFRGPDVVKAWEDLDLGQTDTVLGVPERLSAADHDAVGVNSVLIYRWARVGGRYRLNQIATPPAG